MDEEKTRREEFRVSGDALVAKVKELVREGKIRRILIRSDDGKSIIDLPLSVGVVGAFLVPQLAALGAIAALVTHCTIIVEKEEG